MRQRKKPRAYKAPRAKPKYKVPYQYKLRLDNPNRPDPVIPAPKAHLVWHDGYWRLYRNKWKSQWRTPPWSAACISGYTIPLVTARLRKAHDAWKYGYHRHVHSIYSTV